MNDILNVCKRIIYCDSGRNLVYASKVKYCDASGNIHTIWPSGVVCNSPVLHENGYTTPYAGPIKVGGSYYFTMDFVKNAGIESLTETVSDVKCNTVGYWVDPNDVHAETKTWESNKCFNISRETYYNNPLTVNNGVKGEYFVVTPTDWYVNDGSDTVYPMLFQDADINYIEGTDKTDVRLYMSAEDAVTISRESISAPDYEILVYIDGQWRAPNEYGTIYCISGDTYKICVRRTSSVYKTGTNKYSYDHPVDSINSVGCVIESDDANDEYWCTVNNTGSVQFTMEEGELTTNSLHFIALENRYGNLHADNKVSKITMNVNSTTYLTFSANEWSGNDYSGEEVHLNTNDLSVDKSSGDISTYVSGNGRLGITAKSPGEHWIEVSHNDVADSCRIPITAVSVTSYTLSIDCANTTIDEDSPIDIKVTLATTVDGNEQETKLSPSVVNWFVDGNSVNNLNNLSVGAHTIYAKYNIDSTTIQSNSITVTVNELDKLNSYELSVNYPARMELNESVNVQVTRTEHWSKSGSKSFVVTDLSGYTCDGGDCISMSNEGTYFKLTAVAYGDQPVWISDSERYANTVIAISNLYVNLRSAGNSTYNLNIGDEQTVNFVCDKLSKSDLTQIEELGVSVNDCSVVSCSSNLSTSAINNGFKIYANQSGTGYVTFKSDMVGDSVTITINVAEPQVVVHAPSNAIDRGGNIYELTGSSPWIFTFDNVTGEITGGGMGSYQIGTSSVTINDKASYSFNVGGLTVNMY